MLLDQRVKASLQRIGFMPIDQLAKTATLQRESGAKECALDVHSQRLFVALDEESIMSHLYFSRGAKCTHMFPIVARVASDGVLLNAQRPHVARVRKVNGERSQYYYFENGFWEHGTFGSAHGRCYDMFTENIYVAPKSVAFLKAIKQGWQ